MGMPTIIKGLVSRGLPQPQIDNQPDIARFSRYKDAYVVPIIRKQHALADEGSYFVTNNGQTAITGDTSVAFTNTKPTLSVYNSDTPANSKNVRIHLDYLYLLQGATAYSNATSNTGFFLAAILDAQDGTTGGTDLTPNIVNPNADVSKKASVAVIRFGGLTAPTLTANARTVIGQRLLRLPVSATAMSLANVDEWWINFGGVESQAMRTQIGETGVIAPNKWTSALSVPPIVIGPGQSCFVYLFMVANSAGVAGTLFPEIGWWER